MIPVILNIVREVYYTIFLEINNHFKYRLREVYLTDENFKRRL